MSKEVVLFKSEEKRDLASVAAFLHELADKLVTQEIVLRQGDETLKLEIPKQLVLEVKAEEEAKRKKTERSLEIELEWIVGEEGNGGISLG